MVDARQDFLGTGRRKSSVARVRLRPGDGKVTINDRPLEEFFRTDRLRTDVLAPLTATERKGQVDIVVNVNGGGTTGQSGAVSLGIARALVKFDPELEHALRDKGLLTRDSRETERKKYGKAGARRSFQFSKR